MPESSSGGGSGGGGSPVDATYITQTTNAELSAEQALGALATGFLTVTTTTGVVASRLLVEGTGITLTNTDGSGNPSISTNDSEIDHDALANFTANEHFTMLDEDDMSSNSNTQAATQQSIKSYVDSAVDLVDTGILDSSSNEMVTFTEAAGADSNINISNAAGGSFFETNAPIIAAEGDGADVDLVLKAKGDGYTILSSASGSNFIAATDSIGGAGVFLFTNSLANSFGLLEDGTFFASSPLTINIGGTGQTSYINGQLLIGNSSNGLSKNTLTPGDGIDITNGSGSITIAGEAASDTNAGIIELATVAETDTGTATDRAVTPAALAGWKGPVDLSTHVEVWDDFLWNMDLGTNHPQGAFGFRPSPNGTGATIHALSGLDGHPGILQIETGTTTGGYAYIATYGNAINFGANQLTWEGLVRVPTLSDGTDTFDLKIGFSSSFTTAANTDSGCYFHYSHGDSSGNWETVTDQGSGTITDSSVAVAANTWHKLRMEWNAAGTSVEFFIDGSSVATHTTNLPTGAYGIGVTIVKSAGTTERVVDVDYVYYREDFTTAR